MSPRAVNVPVTGYAKVITAEAPVGYWRLNEPEGSTTAVDAAGSFDSAPEAGEGSFVHGVPTGFPAKVTWPCRSPARPE